MIGRYLPLLRCPVCGGSMERFPGTPDRAACEKNHSYDISRWINFLTHPVTAYYGRRLFEARRDIWNSGIFDPLAALLAAFLKPDICLLDAGCGEGSPLLHTLGRFSDWQKQIRPIGADLSKEGIRLAAGQERDICWLVCDLTHLPLQDGGMDVVFNLLSPACYEEFARVLKPEGLLVKVVPEENYLREIRELLPEKHREAAAPREALSHRLNRHFELLSSQRLTVCRSIPPGYQLRLIRMTPLCAHLSDEECLTLAGRLQDSITLDLTLLTAVPRPQTESMSDRVIF